MAAQWPLITAKLLQILPTLSGWANVPVYDGPPVTGDDPPDYATVGYTGPSDPHAGNYQTHQDASGGQWVEQGIIRCHLTCQSGDAQELPVVRARAFALSDAFEAYVRNDRRLGGVLSQGSSCDLTVDVEPVENADGVAQSLYLTLQYSTAT